MTNLAKLRRVLGRCDVGTTRIIADDRAGEKRDREHNAQRVFHVVEQDDVYVWSID